MDMNINPTMCVVEARCWAAATLGGAPDLTMTGDASKVWFERALPVPAHVHHYVLSDHNYLLCGKNDLHEDDETHNHLDQFGCSIKKGIRVLYSKATSKHILL